MSEHVWYEGAWVEIGGGGGGGADPSDQFPSSLTTDTVNTGSSSRTTFSPIASATPHAVSGVSWTEVDAALSANASAVRVLLVATSATATTDTSTLLEIATGAAASEVVWATIGVGYCTAPTEFIVPGAIAAGTRVSIRVRSAVASKQIDVQVSFITAKSTALGAPVTYQADTATSHGLAITAPGSLNTKGAWTELVASTAADLVALLVCLQGNADTALGSSGILVDIGIGGSGAETVLLADLYYLSSASGESFTRRTPATYGVDIPAGSRISARFARAAAADTIDILLVGALAA